LFLIIIFLLYIRKALFKSTVENAGSNLAYYAQPAEMNKTYIDIKISPISLWGLI
jgi:hypothetical protein